MEGAVLTGRAIDGQIILIYGTIVKDVSGTIP